MPKLQPEKAWSYIQEAKKDGETEQPKQVTRKYRLHPIDMWVLDE
jgi:hypothetical protein